MREPPTHYHYKCLTDNMLLSYNVLAVRGVTGAVQGGADPTPSQLPRSIGIIMNKRCLSTEHLQGLYRMSPCCKGPIKHPYPASSEYPKCIEIHCVECGKIVHEHLLGNYRDEIVWPPPQEWVDRQPPAKRRKRCRRKVLLEQEPQGYRVIY